MTSFDSLNIDQFNEIFDGNTASESMAALRMKEIFWSEDPSVEPIAPSNRCICWRYLFGLLSPRSKCSWVDELNISVVKYLGFRREIFPSISNVGFDPLSDNNPDTLSYFESVEKVKAIELDLNRLYMNGIEDEYFQTKRRNGILQSVLLIWSVQNPSISYRQGMHEIVGTVLHCVERELTAWTSPLAHLQVPEHFLRQAFSEDTVEAHTYWLFTSILESLGTLYDPTLFPLKDLAGNAGRGQRHDGDSNRKIDRVNSNQGVPKAVLYLTEFQGKYLRALDPELWSHLAKHEIHPQFYGLRWSRLLLGREFQFSDTHVLRIWDCLFSAGGHGKIGGGGEGLSPRSEGGAGRVWSRGGSNRNLCSQFEDNDQEQEHSPMLVALREFMLAMLVHMRSELLGGDSSCVLGYLMRFPDMQTLAPIFRIIKDIRRANMHPPSSGPKNTQEIFDIPHIEEADPMDRLLALNRARKEEMWDIDSDTSLNSPRLDTHPLTPPSSQLPNTPSWLDSLKQMSIPTMPSMPSMPSLSFQNAEGESRGGGGGAGGASKLSARKGSLAYLEGQEMESSVPFLSPFPCSPSISSQYSSSGALKFYPDSIVVAVDTVDSVDPHGQESGAFSSTFQAPADEGCQESLFEDEVVGVCSPSHTVGGKGVDKERAVRGRERGGPAPLVPDEGSSSSSRMVGIKEAEGRTMDSLQSAIALEPSHLPSLVPVPTKTTAIPGSPEELEIGDATIGGRGEGLLFRPSPSRMSSSLQFLIGNSSKKKGADLKGQSLEFCADGRSTLSHSAVRGRDIFAMSQQPSSSNGCSGSSSDIGCVCDQLLRLAEDLKVKVVRTDAPIGAADSCIQPSEQGGVGEVVGKLRARLEEEGVIRAETADKLVLLASVLSGRAAMGEFTALYGTNKAP